MTTAVDSRYLFLDEGYNLRPNEITASFGIIQLSRLADFNSKRSLIASIFYAAIDRLANIKGPSIVDNCSPCFMALPVSILNERFTAKYAIDYLESRGVETRPLIAGNLKKHPVAKQLNIQSTPDSLPGADFHHTQSFYVGLSPIVTIESIEELILVFNDLDRLLD